MLNKETLNHLKNEPFVVEMSRGKKHHPDNRNMVSVWDINLLTRLFLMIELYQMSYFDFYLLTLYCLKFTVSYISFYLLIAYCLRFTDK